MQKLPGALAAQGSQHPEPGDRGLQGSAGLSVAKEIMALALGAHVVFYLVAVLGLQASSSVSKLPWVLHEAELCAVGTRTGEATHKGS